MTLEIADVMKIAHLARLGLSEDEAAALGGELTRILDLVAQMDAADTEDVPPMAHPLDMPQRLRPDEVAETDLRDRFQAAAPLTENGLYLVPRVIE
jgi:aspartyl-tRNA(Asn)/glutamyl-tRNA(Gln) amidotransferase subunit C